MAHLTPLPAHFSHDSLSAAGGSSLLRCHPIGIGSLFSVVYPVRRPPRDTPQLLLLLNGKLIEIIQILNMLHYVTGMSKKVKDFH